LVWYLGLATYAVLIPAVAWRIFRQRRRYDVATVLAYLSGILFFLPFYWRGNPLLTYSAWTIAHGVQYQVFLAFHAANRAEGSTVEERPGTAWLVRIATPVWFLLCVLGGYAIWATDWRQSGVYLSLIGNHDLAVRVGITVLNGLTLAHYWVDQFLWRFSSAERRAWLASRYRFLAPSASGAAPVGVVAAPAE
jgi:hypothetical protein